MHILLQLLTYSIRKDIDLISNCLFLFCLCIHSSVNASSHAVGRQTTTKKKQSQSFIASCRQQNDRAQYRHSVCSNANCNTTAFNRSIARNIRAHILDNSLPSRFYELNLLHLEWLADSLGLLSRIYGRHLWWLT